MLGCVSCFWRLSADIEGGDGDDNNEEGGGGGGGGAVCARTHKSYTYILTIVYSGETARSLPLLFVYFSALERRRGPTGSPSPPCPLHSKIEKSAKREGGRERGEQAPMHGIKT